MMQIIVALLLMQNVSSFNAKPQTLDVLGSVQKTIKVVRMIHGIK